MNGSGPAGVDVGFLVGLGHPAGDKNVRPQSIAEVVSLLRDPFPRGLDLELRLVVCRECPAPLVDLPSDDTEIADAIFALASHVFLLTSKTTACIAAIERLFGLGIAAAATVLRARWWRIALPIGCVMFLLTMYVTGSGGRTNPSQFPAEKPNQPVR
jgi:hypothetical protein